MITAVFALRRTASVALAAGALACGGPTAPAAPVRAPARSATTNDDTAERFGLVELARLPGVVALYDPKRWRSVDGGSFTLLEHAPSRSTLAVRVWHAARLVRPGDCEADARLARPSLPRIDPDSIIDSRPLDVPSEFHGSLVVGVDPTPQGSTHGYALAIGAAIGRCYALAFETTADGPDAAVVVAERLRVAADHIVPSLALRNVDERVRPERELK
ncbi:MAG TPA: hypothetical protein VF103_02535 [Polyangiaceae bacterium]